MSASNAELLAQAFAPWGKDNPANMRDVLHRDCELSSAIHADRVSRARRR
jgi:hypothetical protein